MRTLDIAVQASSIVKGLGPGEKLVENQEQRIGKAHGPIVKPQETLPQANNH